MPARQVFFKATAAAAAQLALFMEPTLIQGHLREGKFVGPYMAPRKKRQHDPTAIAFHDAVPTDNPGQLRDDQFVPYKAYRSAIKHTYFGGGRDLSSREVPQRQVQIPLGVWRLDDFKGLHGREISQLREVNIADLILPELDEKGDVAPNKRRDVPQYAQWLQAGMEAPPIEVIETDSRKLKVTDGHRRVLAAKLHSRGSIRAWVSPVTEVAPGLNDSNGRPLMTGLTLELARRV